MNNLAQLSQLITSHFNKNELIEVLYDCNVDHETLPGRTIGSLSIESIQYFQRRERLVDFVKALAKRKPTIDFSPWGAELPAESLHGVLRKLLNAAFNLSNLKTLAFDIYPNLSDELGYKSHAVETIVDTAIKSDSVLMLMEWIRKNNPSQYSAYVMRVDKALQTHKNKEPELVPEIPNIKKQRPQSNVSDVIILTLKMYANGLDDGGKMAKEALRMAKIE